MEADKGRAEKVLSLQALSDSTLYLRAEVAHGAVCLFSYSTDGHRFFFVTGSFQAVEGQGIGAKLGLFCSCRCYTNGRGYADFDWFRVTGPQAGAVPR